MSPLFSHTKGITLLDTPFLYDIVEIFRGAEVSVFVDYEELLGVLREIRETLGITRESEVWAYVEVSPESEPQARFVRRLSELGIKVHVLNYRDCYISRRPSKRDKKSIPSSAPLISAHLATLIEDHTQILVVSGAFELAKVMQEVGGQTHGLMALSYFTALCDPRWEHLFPGFNLLQPGDFFPIGFAPMDPHFTRIVSGVENIAALEALVRPAFRGHEE